jgi:hypothetical protein
MDRELIVQALKSACGNKNIKFQVIVEHEQLYIYINRRENYQPNYEWLSENIGAAIASLALENLDGVWLYSRPLGQVEPEWQTFLELPTQVNGRSEDTISQEAVESELDLTEENCESEDSAGDTGLLYEQGFVHGSPLKETEIDALTTGLREPEILKTLKTDELNADKSDLDSYSLAQYCFVTNKKLLTLEVTPPSKEIIRLVKFFHHLSAAQQLELVPILDKYLKRGEIANWSEQSIPVQNWLKQINQLNLDEQRTAAIWLSRYCADSSHTIEEFKAIAAKNAGETINKKASSPITKYSFTPTNTQNTNLQPEELELSRSQFKLPSGFKQLLLPTAWIMTTLLLLTLGIFSSNSYSAGIEQQIPLCNSSLGSPEYCRLAVELAGKKTIARPPKSLFPLTEVTETIANYGCQRYANLKAGIPVERTAPEITPVISHSSAKIFPHIYVVEAVQKNARQPGNTKVGCVYTVGQGQRSPKKLAADVIPLNWPKENYQQQNTNLSFGRYTNPVNLGLYTIFAALGIAIVSWLNIGIKIKRAATIYLVALILGIIQLAATSFSFLGLFAVYILPFLTILVVSLVIKDFQLDWSRGNLLVMVSMLIVITIQFLSYVLCLDLIGKLI